MANERWILIEDISLLNGFLTSQICKNDICRNSKATTGGCVLSRCCKQFIPETVQNTGKVYAKYDEH